MTANINCSFSTTMDFAVAVNFCNNTGMILELCVNMGLWMFRIDEGKDAMGRITCFDCQFISDYPNEQELFCIGGLNPFTFITIIDVSKNINYIKYIKGIEHMTFGMRDGEDNYISIQNAVSDFTNKQKSKQLP
eukprot:220284_1